MKNIVVDTNVIISALLKSKNCSQILEALKQNKIGLVLSEKLLEEIWEVIGNLKFEFTEGEKQELKELLKEKSKLVEPKEAISICRDIKDNIILECAVSGKVDFIITGDKDLLVLKSFRKIPIVSPRQFLKILS